MNTTPTTDTAINPEVTVPRRRFRLRGIVAALLVMAVVAACGGDEEETSAGASDLACDAEPTAMTTDDDVEFVRTPDSCFEDLPDWPYEPQYVEIDGLRQAYVDEGPADGEVVLLLHGQPSWSYLYRDMIPVLADAGYRVIAMDHLGMGRSDKPTELESYSYLGHNDRLEAFIDELGLTDINLFVQDWGSLIGLRVAGLNPDLFATIAVGDGALPLLPEGVEPFPPVENPNVPADVPSPFTAFPAQQVPFYDGCEPLLGPEEGYFGDWIVYSMTAESFQASEVVEALTWYDLTAEEEAAYDAPFPSRIYMGGPRTFPSLVNQVPGQTAEAWEGLMAFDKPFLTLWAANDPGNLGQCATQQNFIDNVPGAEGQPHDRLPESSHFLQDDQGTEIATRLVDWYANLGEEPSQAQTAEAAETTALNPEMELRRYCEILLVDQTDNGLQAEVWGTQTLNRCPAESWAALDAEAIKAETGALAVVMNGPRYWLVDAEGSVLESEERRTFGDLEMRYLTSVDLSALSGLSDTIGPYTETTVLRATTYTYPAGDEVYELTSPEGDVYIMQSMSQMVDPNLMLDELPELGEQLDLPEGWTYQARILDEDLVLVTQYDAVVTQDELSNSYQLRTDGASENVATDRVGFEILEVRDDGTIRAWIATEMTQEQFDAIDLPAGWFKNQPREGQPDASRFLGSPGANGVLIDEVHFGYEWLHSATIISTGDILDNEGLIRASTVEKDHEVSFDPGSTLSLLISPEGDAYVLVSRDAGRSTDEPTVPSGWRVAEYAAEDGFTTQLSGKTTVIRMDNEDSFQGPVTGLDLDQ